MATARRMVRSRLASPHHRFHGGDMTDARDRIIGTRLEFHEALREAFAEAAHVGCRELWLSDEDFADWPLGERGVVEQLTRWALPHRRLFVVARHFDEVVRQHARWVEWRT